jgi:hypothetical protein
MSAHPVKLRHLLPCFCPATDTYCAFVVGLKPQQQRAQKATRRRRKTISSTSYRYQSCHAFEKMQPIGLAKPVGLMNVAFVFHGSGSNGDKPGVEGRYIEGQRNGGGVDQFLSTQHDVAELYGDRVFICPVRFDMQR